MAELNDLLRQLSIGAKETDSSNELEKELEKTVFGIFESTKDLGYVYWNPDGASYKRLSDIERSEEIVRYIDFDGKPSRLKPIRSIRTPQSFQTFRGKEYENRFPYGQIDIACLHTIVKVRQIILRNRMPFIYFSTYTFTFVLHTERISTMWILFSVVQLLKC